MPYRTQDKRIDGVVITFVDVGIAKSKEVALRKALDLIESTQNSAKVQQPEQAPKDPAQVLRDLRELLEQPLIASDTARPVENDKAHLPS
jgi:two-component system CheB/CheR fusion protein